MTETSCPTFHCVQWRSSAIFMSCNFKPVPQVAAAIAARLSFNDYIQLKSYSTKITSITMSFSSVGGGSKRKPKWLCFGKIFLPCCLHCCIVVRTQYPEFAYLWPRVGIFKFQPKISPRLPSLVSFCCNLRSNHPSPKKVLQQHNIWLCKTLIIFHCDPTKKMYHFACEKQTQKIGTFT